MICAVDPSTKKLAFAVGSPTARAKALFTGELPTGGGAGDLGLIQQWIRGLVAMGVTHMAFELPYLGKNVASFQRLCEVRAIVEACAKGECLTWIPVNPAQWQSACLSCGKGRGTQGMKREVVKPLAMRYAEDVIGAKPSTQDIADAICIHQYAVKVALPAMAPKTAAEA